MKKGEIISLAGARRAKEQENRETPGAQLARSFLIGFAFDRIASFLRDALHMECPDCGEPEEIEYVPPVALCRSCHASWHEGIDGRNAERFKPATIADLAKAP